MEMNKTAASLAIAAASLFATAVPAFASAGENSEVHCYGVNVCKGHNDCKTAANACKGQAACKGQGFVSISEKACADIGGTVGK
ncbi:MAG: hypothetical protein KAI44_04430 [Methylococcales bacterium]|nr:hypothetical protein [Methylococcales bacterium]MCK5478140.1 hypothetical protein [Methylococcales bacterium]